MKLTAVLVLIATLQTSAAIHAQKVTLSVNKAPMNEVFTLINQQTGYTFFYDKSLIDQAGRISLIIKDAPLPEVLDLLLKPHHFTYNLHGRIIVISGNPERPGADPTAPTPDTSPADSLITVKGRIINDKGEGLASATIRVKGHPHSAMADADGSFILKNVTADALLEISYLGYGTKIVHAKADLGPVKLEMNNARLDEVQVIGYGTTTRRLTTGSVSKVSSEEIERSPVSDPIIALEGKVAGLYITENSGVAGSSFNVLIQGQNTISAGKLPLYIIDGVPFDASAVEQAVGGFVSPPSIIGNNGFNPLNSLSSNDIESIEVLKDADATAIYGSRAANGVIVVTTKKGKSGATRINADLYTGSSHIVRTLPMLSSAQYIAMRQKAFANDGITPTTVNAPDLTLFAKGWDNDYQKDLMKTGHFTSASLDLSGGDRFTQFLVGGTLRHEAPVFPGPFSDQRVQVHFNIQHSSADNRFKMNASGSYTDDQNNLPTFNLYSFYNLPPNLPLRDTTGKLAWYTGYTNPLSSLINTTQQHNVDLLGNLSLSYRIIGNLSFKTDMGFHRTEVDNIAATFRAGKNPSSASAATGTVFRVNSERKLYTIEPQLNYSTAIGKGTLQALVGGTYQYSDDNKPYFYFGSFTSDALYQDIGSITISSKSSGFSERRYASLFGRLNYTWDNKYIINANFRRDGSSAFSPGHRFGNFGSLGGAWIVTEEKGMKETLPWLSFGKLRASYGTIGNDQIPVYGYFPYYGSTFFTYSGTTGLIPAQLANNNNYSWELTKKLDIAADLGFLKDRILFSAAWYRNITNNMLLTVPIGTQVGFSGYTGNVPGARVGNTGIELELNTVNIKSKDFSWKMSLNVTIPKNKLLAFPGLANSSFATGGLYRTGTTPGYVIGQSLNMLFGYKFTGFKNGVATVKDLNGDGVITPGLYPNGQGDWVPLGTSDPTCYGGFANSFSYKGFQLDILLQFTKKKNFNIYHGVNNAPGMNSNQPKDILNLPVPYSTLASSPASAAYINYYGLSDATVSDASYLRLKNVSLSYNLPVSWTKPLKMQNAAVYFRAQNLFTITRYKGFDPESFGTTLALYRMISFGFKTSL